LLSEEIHRGVLRILVGNELILSRSRKTAADSSHGGSRRFESCCATNTFNNLGGATVKAFVAFCGISSDDVFSPPFVSIAYTDQTISCARGRPRPTLLEPF
jgi:hypothetical protein